VCSFCLTLIDQPDCPMYALLQFIHLSLYIPLGFMLVGFSVNCWCVVLVARRAMFRLVCLKRLVTFLINGLWYVRVTHFLFCCVVVISCFCSCFCFCFLISFSFILCIMCMGKPLFCFLWGHPSQVHWRKSTFSSQKKYT